VSRQAILVTAPLGLGALLLSWAALSARGEPPPRAPRRPRAGPAAKAPAPAPATEPAAAPDAPAAEPTGADPVILERIRAMEEKVRQLESRRDALAAENDRLQKKGAEKALEFSSRSMAQGRVWSWEALLGLTPEQKQSLADLWAGWIREDGGRPAGQDVWKAREGEIRSRFTVEQAAKLGENAAAQGRMMWSHLGRSLGSMVGASREDQARFQQSLGDWFPPSGMLLPEAHGADWKGLMREASNRLRSQLTAEQSERIDKLVRN